MPTDAPAAPIGLAFLGCGLATRIHSKRLRGTRDVRRYYASRDAARAAEYSRRFGGEGSFGSYEAALGDARVTCALVATPPATHLDLTLRALAAGKDVIVEKPAFLRAADVDQVAAAAARAGRRVFVAENYHYKPIAAELRKLIAAGAFGDVRFVQVNALKHQPTPDWRADPALAGGGALFEGGVHWVSFMANLGLTVTAVRGARPRGTGDDAALERSMLAVFEYAEGAVGTLAHSWEIASPLKGLRLSGIFGTRGSAVFESNGLGLLVLGGRRRLALPGVRDFLGYGAMFRDFVDALRTGREPAMTLALARRDLELVEEIYRTAGGEGPGARSRELAGEFAGGPPQTST